MHFSAGHRKMRHTRSLKEGWGGEKIEKNPPPYEVKKLHFLWDKTLKKLDLPQNWIFSPCGSHRWVQLRYETAKTIRKTENLAGRIGGTRNLVTARKRPIKGHFGSIFGPFQGSPRLPRFENKMS